MKEKKRPKGLDSREKPPLLSMRRKSNKKESKERQDSKQLDKKPLEFSKSEKKSLNSIVSREKRRWRKQDLLKRLPDLRWKRESRPKDSREKRELKSIDSSKNV